MRGLPDGLAPDRVRHHRTIFISDVHLGTPGCKAELLADFLTHNDCRTLYLVGDIVDFWRLKRSWFWSAAHSRVIDAILAKVKSGTRVIYVPGNHDEAFRDYCGVLLAGVELLPEATHRTADGRELLVLHGDSSTASSPMRAGWHSLATGLTPPPSSSAMSSTAPAAGSGCRIGRSRRS